MCFAIQGEQLRDWRGDAGSHWLRTCDQASVCHIYDHPAMRHLRDWVAFEVAKKRFHNRLIANFDQVWSLNFRPRSSTLNPKDPVAKQKTLRQVRHRLELSLGLPLTESLVEDESAERKGPRELAKGGAVAHSPVEGFRVPHTLTTLSWRDGALGRGWVTFHEEHLSDRQRHTLNEEKWQREQFVLGLQEPNIEYISALLLLVIKCIYIYIHI